ncbi:MAG: hypothetical protein P4M09_19195 [Devosia sp.]|nr:hypothetical protein [Devosia sp.]
MSADPLPRILARCDTLEAELKSLYGQTHDPRHPDRPVPDAIVALARRMLIEADRLVGHGLGAIRVPNLSAAPTAAEFAVVLHLAHLAVVTLRQGCEDEMDEI